MYTGSLRGFKLYTNYMDLNETIFDFVFATWMDYVKLAHFCIFTPNVKIMIC